MPHYDTRCLISSHLRRGAMFACLERNSHLAPNAENLAEQTSEAGRDRCKAFLSAILQWLGLMLLGVMFQSQLTSPRAMAKAYGLCATLGDCRAKIARNGKCDVRRSRESMFEGVEGTLDD